MELRHLRYFVAVAEEGSLTVAAERRLHTAQPSLSRQLRDLEQEVGATLFIRSARGVALTPAGQAFLEHARRALQSAADAVAAARRAARPSKPGFAVGFLTGQEVDWLSHVTHLLRGQLKDIDFRVMSDFSPEIGAAIQRGEIDLGFCRVEPQPDVTYKVIAHEPILVVLPRDHPLAARSAIDVRDIDPASFIGYADTPHVLRDIATRYLRDRGVVVRPRHHRHRHFAGGVHRRRHPAAGLCGAPAAAIAGQPAACRQPAGDRDCGRLSGGQSLAGAARLP